MPTHCMTDTGADLGLRRRHGSGDEGIGNGSRLLGRVSAVLIGFGAFLQVAPASSEPAVCQSLVGAAQQACGVAASIPKASDVPNADDGDAVRVVAPLSSDAFHAIASDRIGADPGSLLRKAVAVGPAQCFYFKVGDYRCVVMADNPVVVAAPIVIPQESQVSVEQGCAQGATGATQPCTYRIMFVPVSLHRDAANQSGAVVFRTPNIMAVAKGAAPSGSDGQP